MTPLITISAIIVVAVVLYGLVPRVNELMKPIDGKPLSTNRTEEEKAREAEIRRRVEAEMRFRNGEGERSNRQFNFQIDYAFRAGEGKRERFTTITGTLLDGTIQAWDFISLPTNDGSRLIATLIDIGVSTHGCHHGPLTGRTEGVAFRTWGSQVDPKKIQLLGIATRSDIG